MTVTTNQDSSQANLKLKLVQPSPDRSQRLKPAPKSSLDPPTKSSPKAPGKSIHQLTTAKRGLILVSIILWNAGLWSLLDFPQTLGDPLINHFKITTKEVGCLYTISAAFNVVTSPLTGLLISRLGVSTVATITLSFQILGAMLLYLSVSAESYSLLVLGRCFYAMGAEPTLICQAAASEKWFSGKMLSISMGLNLSCGMAIASLSNFITPILIVETRDLETAFLYYVCLCTLSFIAVAGFNVLDWKYEAQLEQEKAILGGFGLERAGETSGRESATNTINLRSMAETEREAVTGTPETQKYVFKVSDLTKLSPVFWCCVSLYAIAANTYYQFTSTITNMAVHRYNYTFLEAKNFISTIQILSACLMPVNSILIQRIGKKPKVILIATILLLAGFVNLALTPAHPSLQFEASIALIALFYISYQSTIFPCMAMSLPREAVSVGLGTASFFQAVPLGLSAYLFGDMVKQETAGVYQRVLSIIIGMALVSVGLAWFAVRTDARLGGLLDAPENSEKARRVKAAMEAQFRRDVGGGGQSGQDVVDGSSKVVAGTIQAGSDYARSVRTAEDGNGARFEVVGDDGLGQ